jgi:hypothetical protein
LYFRRIFGGKPPKTGVSAPIPPYKAVEADLKNCDEILDSFLASSTSLFFLFEV